MKKTILIVLIGIVCILVILIAAGCIRPILPGSHVEIVYPAPDAVVPNEFSVLAVAAKWPFGIETNPVLFMASPESHVGLPPSVVELSLDGVPYARSDGGNHHVFRIVTLPGDHTVGLTTPYGHTEITVHVTDDPPVAFRPFDSVPEYAASADTLTKALFDFIQTSPTFSVPDDPNAQMSPRIYLAGDAAFVLFEQMKAQVLSAFEARYVAPIDSGVTPDDIGNAPVVFMWDAASWERPVKLAVLGGGPDRLSLFILDDITLTVFSIFPDGNTARSDFRLSDIAPGLAESIASSSLVDITTKTGRDTLYIKLDTYQTDGSPGRLDLLIRARAARIIDLGGRDVDGVTPAGDLITTYPASLTGPFDSALIGDAGKTSFYLPLPRTDDTFAFTGGSVHDIGDFYPEHPRFEIGPLVPLPGCMGQYIPVHCGVAGDVTFGPDMLKTTLGGREEYFIMGQ